MLTNSSAQFTLKQAVESFLLSITDLLSESFDGNSAPLIISDLQILLSSNSTSGLIRKQIPDLLIVDLRVTDSYSNCLVEFVAGQGIELSDSARHNTTILKHCGAACHAVCLTSTSLAVAKHGAVVTLDDRLNNLGCTDFVSFILARIVQDLFKVKLPDISLIVDETKFLILILLKSDSARGLVNLNVVACEVCRRSGTNHDLNCLL